MLKTVQVSSHFACVGLLIAGACHTDVAVEDGASATEAAGILSASAADGDSEPIPTTSDGSDSDGGVVDPVKYCELRPEESYEGVC